MKLLANIWIKAKNCFLFVPRVIITSISSLLIYLRTLLNVGFVIIGVGVLGVLLGATVLIHNYMYETKYQTKEIFRELVLSLWKMASANTINQSKSQENLEA